LTHFDDDDDDDDEVVSNSSNTEDLSKDNPTSSPGGNDSAVQTDESNLLRKMIQDGISNVLGTLIYIMLCNLFGANSHSFCHALT
jgi:hypothetical protein